MSVGAVPALPSVVSGLNTTSPLRGSFAGPVPAWRFAGGFVAEGGRPERPPLHSFAGSVSSRRFADGFAAEGGRPERPPLRSFAGQGPSRRFAGRFAAEGARPERPPLHSFAGSVPSRRFAGRFAAEGGRPERPPQHSLAGNLYISKLRLPPSSTLPLRPVPQQRKQSPTAYGPAKCRGARSGRPHSATTKTIENQSSPPAANRSAKNLQITLLHRAESQSIRPGAT